ncbi:hypothetical protein ACFVVM_09355 [Nocardia sp. NPDC058176]|uniref:hypothetical protein n=1 Tax=Nocardia sp. NPDC058176 TaxID=3346368 RepID=UPI0036DB0AFC
MTDLLTRSQLRMLAQTLNVEPAMIESLARLGAQDLRALRERISELLFDADEPVFARLSTLAPLVPNTLVTKVVATVVPPEVGGRAGGALGLAHPNRVADVLSALPAQYLADAAPHLDPRTIGALAPLLSGTTLIPTAIELLRRRDYTTANRFIEHATDALIDDLERGIDDDIGLLRAVSVTPDTDRLNAVLARIPAARQTAVLRATTADTDETLLAGLSILARLDDESRAHQVTALIEALDTEELTRVVSVAAENDALGELLTALAATGEPVRRRVAEIIGAAGDLAAALGEAASTDELRGLLADLRALHA